MIWIPRAVGVLTAVYGMSAVAMPGVIGRHGGYRGWESRESAVRLLSAVVGVRDIVSGIAIVLAPSGGVLLAAIAARVAFDLTDCVAFGTLLPEPAARRKVALIAGGWGALAAVSAVFAT
jgi:hypothetical protein